MVDTTGCYRVAIAHQTSLGQVQISLTGTYRERNTPTRIDYALRGRDAPPTPRWSANFYLSDILRIVGPKTIKVPQSEKTIWKQLADAIKQKIDPEYARLWLDRESFDAIKVELIRHSLISVSEKGWVLSPKGESELMFVNS